MRASGNSGVMRGVPCKIDGCERQVRARELCGAHYNRWHKYGDPEIQVAPGGPPTTPAALDRHGLTKKQREYWISRGYLKVPMDRKSGRRTWNVREVRVALLMARLVAAGFTPEAAARLARRVVAKDVGVLVLGDLLELRLSEPEADRNATLL